MSVTVRRRRPRFDYGGSVSPTLPAGEAVPSYTPGGFNARGGAVRMAEGGPMTPKNLPAPHFAYGGAYGIPLQAPSIAMYTAPQASSTPAAPPVSNAFTASAQGMPAASPAGGYTPGPESNAAGSWGSAATNTSAQNAVTGDYSGSQAPAAQGTYQRAGTKGNYGAYNVQPTAPQTPAAPANLNPTSNMVMVAKGGAIPEFDAGGVASYPGDNPDPLIPNVSAAMSQGVDLDAMKAQDQANLDKYDKMIGPEQRQADQAAADHLKEEGTQENEEEATDDPKAGVTTHKVGPSPGGQFIPGGGGGGGGGYGAGGGGSAGGGAAAGGGGGGGGSGAVSADSGGAIPETDDAGSDDQGNNKQDDGGMGGVQAALTASRQQFGLNDQAFNGITDALLGQTQDLDQSSQVAGNMPAKPAGPGGDQPNLNPFPTKTPATPFGTKSSQNEDQDENDTNSGSDNG